MVLANGDLVVEKGKITVVDREEVAAKLRESLPADYSADFERRHTVLRKLRPYIAEWFAPWYDEMEGFEGEAFYHLNNRK
jgi:hypothetical protein